MRCLISIEDMATRTLILNQVPTTAFGVTILLRKVAGLSFKEARDLTDILHKTGEVNYTRLGVTRDDRFRITAKINER